MFDNQFTHNSRSALYPAQLEGNNFLDHRFFYVEESPIADAHRLRPTNAARLTNGSEPVRSSYMNFIHYFAVGLDVHSNSAH